MTWAHVCESREKKKGYVDVDKNTSRLPTDFIISQLFFPLGSRTAHMKINQRFQIFSPSDDEKSFSRENRAFHVKNVLVADFIDEIWWLLNRPSSNWSLERKVWQQRGDHLSLNSRKGLKRDFTLRLTKFAVSSLKSY